MVPDKMHADGEPYVCVRQRAGPFVKTLITDNYAYLRRYGPGAVRGRCGPALSRTSLDKLELRLALFGYDGIFYSLTFDDDHLPSDRAGAERVWDAFLKRLRRWKRGPVDFYVYRIEGLHGDHRLHIHTFLRDADFPPAVVQFLWRKWGAAYDVPWTRERVLSEQGYRGLAIYFTKETPEVGRHPWGCSRALSKYISPPEVSTCKSGMVRLPKGATPLPMQGRDRPKLESWGLYGYSRYLLPGK